MAQTITGAAASRVNRRFLFLALVLAVLSAVLVYAALSQSGGGDDGAATTIPVVVAKVPIPAGTRITADMVELRQIPETFVGAQAVSTVDSVVGRVARYEITANDHIVTSQIAGLQSASNDVLSHILESQQRGMAITASMVIGAGGLVLPGDHVDILWIPEKPLNDTPGAQLIAENVEVVAVQQTLVELPVTAPGVVDEADEPASGGDRVRGSEAQPIPEAVTVTLMLSPEEATRVFCGEQTGSLRLAVRAFGDNSPSGLSTVVCIIRGEDEQA